MKRAIMAALIVVTFIGFTSTTAAQWRGSHGRRGGFFGVRVRYYGPGFSVYPGMWNRFAGAYGNAYGSAYQAYTPVVMSGSGVKFSLDQIPSGDKKAVTAGDVCIPDQNGQLACYGSVGQFSGKLHGSLPLNPGTYTIVVEASGRPPMEMIIGVQPGRVTTVMLRLEKQASQPEQ